jgi:hypothetical protein
VQHTLVLHKVMYVVLLLLRTCFGRGRADLLNTFDQW